ncbi:MAG: uracil-DNA glycosylase [Rickettsiales bacterium]|jgi:DNA polymerase|nr:uracil-DNA glycosylase [Rickettsiales bacterium]
MWNAENILKSLALAGVEWELREPGAIGAKSESAGNAAAAPIANPARQTPHFSAPKAARPLPSADILETARKLAASDDIISAIKSFKEHPLFSGAKNTVVPHLPPPARPPLLVITDIPSLADDASGNVLSGAEGELFDKMLGAIGLSRERVAITPLVFWRPAGGRTPLADEISFCKPFVDKIVARAQPEKILTLGALAAREIAGASLPREHGKVFGNVIPIYKPDFILANPAVKKDVWEALKQVTMEGIRVDSDK